MYCIICNAHTVHIHTQHSQIVKSVITIKRIKFTLVTHGAFKQARVLFDRQHYYLLRNSFEMSVLTGLNVSVPTIF